MTLPDGSQQSVLVPQVYLRVRPGDVNGNGALLAGQEVHLNLSGDAVNSGTIAGRNLVQLNAANIRNTGGTIQAQSAAWLNAGRDLNLVAAAIDNAGSGPTQLIADNNINLGTVNTGRRRRVPDQRTRQHRPQRCCDRQLGQSH